MKKFTWREFKNYNIAVHCSSKRKAKNFIKECKKNEITWFQENSNAEKTFYWEEHGGDTCYTFIQEHFGQGLMYGSIDFFENRGDYLIVEWEIEEPINKFKIIDLLEAGKKATHKDLCGKNSYLFLEDGNIFISNEDTEGNRIMTEYNLSYSKLTSDEWEEYKEHQYKTNFEFNVEDECILTLLSGPCTTKWYDTKVDRDILDSFLAFKKEDEKLSEYIKAKQLLQRKLMIFSYLNEGDTIDWDTTETKYYIEYCRSHYPEENIRIKPKHIKCNEHVYFKTKQIAEKALELYKEDIRKVLELDREFNF